MVHAFWSRLEKQCEKSQARSVSRAVPSAFRLVRICCIVAVAFALLAVDLRELVEMDD